MHRVSAARLIMPARELIEAAPRARGGLGSATCTGRRSGSGNAATLLPPRYYGLGDRTEGRRHGRYGRSPSSYSRQPRSFCRFRSNGKLPVGGLHVPVRSISLVHALAPVKLCARRAHDPLPRYRSRA